MSLRTLTRLLLLDLAALFLAPLLLGPWSLLAGPGLLLLTGLALVCLAARPAPGRWRLRYHRPPAMPLPPNGANTRLTAMLRFLARHTRPVLEAHAGGLFLELPPAYDEYIQVQVPLALPETKIVPVKEKERDRKPAACYLALDADGAEALRWATQAEGRRVRIHLRETAVTLTAETGGEAPPGRWLRLPAPSFALGLWRRLPVWNELSGPPDDGLLPPTGDDDVYNSRSSLLKLAPPPDYRPVEDGRILGRATDGQVISLSPGLPLLVAGAPEEFLVQQALQDLARGSVVVVSPHRSALKLIRSQADAGVPALWLDLENSQASARLAMATAADWPRLDRDTLADLALAFLGELGLHVEAPALGAIARRLVHALADSARLTGRDLPFTDLYAISQSSRGLRAFLGDLQDLFPDPAQPIHDDVVTLLDLLAAEEGPGYAQVSSLLDTLRRPLRPLHAGPLHILCQPPFADLAHHLAGGGLLLAPLSGEFVEHHHLFSRLLDLVLRRTLATAGPELHLALHLHEPHLYRAARACGPGAGDDARRWLVAAQADDRLSLLASVQEPAAYSRLRAAWPWPAELAFRCPEPLAGQLAAEWNLPAGSAADLAELPPQAALARLPGLTATFTLEDLP